MKTYGNNYKCEYCGIIFHRSAKTKTVRKFCTLNHYMLWRKNYISPFYASLLRKDNYIDGIEKRSVEEQISWAKLSFIKHKMKKNFFTCPICKGKVTTEHGKELHMIKHHPTWLT